MFVDQIPEIQVLSLEEKRTLMAELAEEIAFLESLEAEPSSELAAAIDRRVARNLARPEAFRTTEEVLAKYKKNPDA
jgi:hypothetical protein